ncbi:hypothetical protein QEN19_004216 [Hanseniaspora menglaensis]
MDYKLSPVQRFFNYREQVKKFSSRVYVGTQLIDSFKVDISNLQKIVAEIINKDNNKQLLAQIDSKTNNVYLLNFEKLDFSQFVHIIDDSKFTDIGDNKFVEEMVKTKFEIGIDLPLWRIVYLPKLNYLIFNYGHVFFDGMTGVNFMKKVLNKFEGVTGEVNSADYHSIFDNICTDKSLLDLNIIDAYPRRSLNFSNVVILLRHVLLPEFVEAAMIKMICWFPALIKLKLFQKFNRFQNSQKTYPGQHFVKHSLINISAEKTKKLIKLSRQNNVTLNSLLVTLFALSSPKSIESAGFTNKIDIPINLRTRFSAFHNHKDVLGLLVAPVTISTPIIQPLKKKKHHFEELVDYVMKYANKINDSIQSEINSSGPVNAMGLINIFTNDKNMKSPKDYGDLDMLLPENPSLKRDFEVSNLGLFFNSKLVKDVIFNQSYNMRSAHMTVSALGSVVGGTNLSCMYSDDDKGKSSIDVWHLRFTDLVNNLLEATDNQEI